jgi:hypothetical protein
METFVQDVNHTLRIFRKNPGFTISAVTALALGIGANTAIFSVINAVLLIPVRYFDPDRVVMFMTTTPEGQVYLASDPKFNAWRQESSVFQDVSGYRYGTMNLTSGDYPGPGQWRIAVVENLSTLDPLIERLDGASQEREGRLRGIQNLKPAAEGGRIRHAMRILHRGRRRFQRTAFDKVAP